MSKLPNELIGHYSSSLLYDPNTLRFGAYEGEYHLHERKVNRKVLQGKIKVLQLQTAYATSYASTSEPALIHIRDLFISLACNWVVRSLQYKDASATALTMHANRFWQSEHGLTYAHSLDAQSLDESLVANFHSTLGSVLYQGLQGYELELANYPLAWLGTVLDSFWSDLGITRQRNNPAQRHEALLTQELTPTVPLLRINTALNKIAETPVTLLAPETKVILANIRQHLLTSSDWDNLPQRFLLGEYSNALVNVIKQVQYVANTSEAFRTFSGLEQQDVNNIDRLQEKLITSLPPTGYLLIYGAFAVEGLHRAAERLNKIDTDLSLMSYSEFIKNSTYPELKLELASDLALAYDAFAALGFFSSIQEAKALSYRCYLCATQLLQALGVELEPIGDTRLYKFVELE